MLFPGLRFFTLQAVREIPCAVAEQQLGQAPVIKTRTAGGQLVRRMPAQRFQAAPVALGDEAAIQVFVDIDVKAGSGRALEHLLPGVGHVRPVRGQAMPSGRSA